MAEALFRKLLSEEHPELQAEASSAGVSAANGSYASANSIRALADLKIDLARHRSRPLTGEIVGRATLILAMTRGHRDLILSYFPEAEGKTHLLGDFSPKQGNPDISDPFGGPLDLYQRCRDQIARALPGVLRFINPAK